MKFALLVGLFCTSVSFAGTNGSAANAASSMADLTSVTGVYSGKVHLVKSNQDYDCSLTTAVVMRSVGQEPNDEVQVPGLMGSVEFPALNQATLSDLSQFADLVEPMGGDSRIQVNNGEYVPASGQLNLPYFVPGSSSGIFGEFTGAIVNGHFKGIWFSKDYGNVGTFDLVKK